MTRDRHTLGQGRVCAGQAMIRAVCAILDAFHFPLEPTPGPSDPAEAATSSALPDQATAARRPSRKGLPDQAAAGAARTLTGLPDQAGTPGGAQEALPEQAAGGEAGRDEAVDDVIVGVDEEEQGRSEGTGEAGGDHSKAVQDTLVRVVLPSLRSQLVLPSRTPLDHGVIYNSFSGIVTGRFMCPLLSTLWCTACVARSGRDTPVLPVLPATRAVPQRFCTRGFALVYNKLRMLYRRRPAVVGAPLHCISRAVVLLSAHVSVQKGGSGCRW